MNPTFASEISGNLVFRQIGDLTEGACADFPTRCFMFGTDGNPGRRRRGGSPFRHGVAEDATAQDAHPGFDFDDPR